MMEIIEIDGSIGEGGGQVLRTAIALSALSLKPVKVYNIRVKRSNPGLRPQHLVGLKILAMLTKANVEGLSIGSTEILFKPRKRLSGDIRVDVGTAGSISLVLQAILPALAFAPSRTTLEITGGTDVKWSPPIDYMKNVFLPYLRKMGYNVEIQVLRRGHYPRGGGKVKVIANPVRKINSIVIIKRGEITNIKGISHCVKLPKHVAERQASAAKNYLEKHGFANVDIALEWYEPMRDYHLGPGSGIVLWAKSKMNTILGADALGERGKRAEEVGREAAEKLMWELRREAPIDSHLADMLPPYMAIAEGTSEIYITNLTLHAETNIMIVEQILGVKFKIERDKINRAKIRVKGIGLINTDLSNY